MITTLSQLRRRRFGVSVGAAFCLVALGLTTGATGATGATAHARAQSEGRGFVQVNLVSDQPGAAALTDPNLVNAWGLAQGPATPIWVSDNGTDVSTLYTGGGAGGHIAAVPLVVSLPGGAPTGQVYNPGNGFTLGNGMPARFIFAGEDGVITAWNPQLTPRTAAVQVASVPGAVFKGIAEFTGHQGAKLLVADFGRGLIDVFDSSFHPVTLKRGAFTDRRLPTGYAPFNVAVFGERVFVSYALKLPGGGDDVSGAGHGFIDVFSPNGRLLQRFASHGALNSPWGLAIAPKGFGAFSGHLLVGNFGDGRINVFDLRSGSFDGPLRRTDGSPIVIDGLWGLLPGNGTSAATSDVWFSAGPVEESHGLLGVIRAAHH